METADLKRRDGLEKRETRAAELEHLRVRVRPSVLIPSMVRHSGLAVGAWDLLLRAPGAHGRPPVAAPLGLHAAVAVLLP